jgi:predicted TPR repeat methyltransferase
VREAFDHFASSFDSSLARLEYRAPALVAEAVAAAIGDPRRSLVVLDAGCGTGLCGEHLRAYAKRLVGVDLSGRMLERARERDEYDELVEGELTEFLERQAAAYDLVVSADTLVYFGALEAVAAAASRALRAGGHVTFTVERSDESDAPAGHRLHPHGRYSHTEPYLRRVLGDAGLDVTSLREVELRKEAGKWVRGSLVTAKKPAGASAR